MVTIEGTIEEIIFSNEVNGYTVCEIKNEKNTYTVVGYMPFINVGETLKVSGTWVTHPDYGDQLKVELYEKVMPQTVDGVEKYLASGVIKGIGPATAKKIVQEFGDETLHIIEFQPGRLSEIRGINLDKALKIGQAFNEQRELRRIIMFFQEYGVSATYSTKIYRTFGENTIEIIKENPYKLADEIFGIGFKTADRIARSMGIDMNASYRICSGIKYVLSQAGSNGHTFLPLEKVKEIASQLLEIRVDLVDHAIVSLVMEKSIFTENRGEGQVVYLAPFYYAEVSVSRKLMSLSAVDFKKDVPDFDERIGRVQKEEKIVLAAQQKEAIRQALINGVLVITGGPGTGKTTIIKSIIKLFQREGCRIELAAPTGRAAKRMTETTGCEARTIHRLLEIGYTEKDEEQVFAKGEDNPIEADVVIIDESSMIDILLMNHLLKAIEPGTRLILVGDVDQLPPVGAGNVLKDIISSDIVKIVKLTEVFRQAQESMIIVNAHKVNKGEYPELNLKGKDFFFVQRSRTSDILQTIVDLCQRRLPEYNGYDALKHIQVLAPGRKGPIGVQSLNNELQKSLNPGDRKKTEKVYRDAIFREGDKVMQVKNNYNLKWEKNGQAHLDGMGVFNGDQGIITRLDLEEQRITVLFDDDRVVHYDFGILDELELAYSVTVHKSQGSEFPVVVMPVFAGPKLLLTRNLLYTGITRAKELVVLVGSEAAIRDMVDNNRETLRYSGLADKLKQAYTASSPFF